MRKVFNLTIFLILLRLYSFGDYLLIPMDLQQTNHLKSYGIMFNALNNGIKGEWLLNYRGGSFLLPYHQILKEQCLARGVYSQQITNDEANAIFQLIEEENMERIILEKAPKIAVYAPDYYQPWDDAVLLAMEYAEIPYTRIYDKEVFLEDLSAYDWLHLHHEDFTGQFGKFYGNYRNASWYREQVSYNMSIAAELGFPDVPALKKQVALKIREYVNNGGFLFAMCSATDALDIALAAHQTDIVETPFDGDPPAPDYQSKLDFNITLAFKNFTLYPNPNLYEYSDIDTPPSYAPRVRDAETDFFTLFDFSAKYDPVPSMLVQNHVNSVKGFMGQTTMFKRDKIKEHVVILGEIEETDQIKYIHGYYGKGTFTFLGGHDPEDYTHAVSDPPTNLALHVNSPGYRLILNNILFPAARKKKLKT